MRFARALVAALLVLSSAAATTAAELISAESVAAADIQAWHWNIFGTCDTQPRRGNCGSTRTLSGHRPEDYLEFLVLGSANRPWTISLNEVCGRQMEAIKSRLQPYGYTLRFAKSDGVPGAPGAVAPTGVPFGSVNCGAASTRPGDATFGNAILVLGSITGWSYPADYYYPGTTRNYTCITPNTFFGTRMGCATHLHKDLAVNETEDDLAYIYSVNFTVNQGHKLVLGADRNRTDHLGWPTLFSEFDHRATKMRTHPSNNPDRKIDWIYAGPRANHITLTVNDRVCVSGIQQGSSGWSSDHCLIWGTYRI